ncbi:MAG: YibE/F family protein [Treponema sp.]|nr:YibE/F family protein [Treponema sp.]MCL2236733.1 YibE/F family protein [Treponema sp.]
MIRISIPYLITIFFSILILVIGHNLAISGGISSIHNTKNEIVRAKVIKIVEEITPEYDELMGSMMPGKKIIFEALVTGGNKKGDVLKAEQNFSSLSKNRLREVKAGDSVLLINNFISWNFEGFYRVNWLVILGILFVICLISFGGKKGFNTVLSLVLTCISVFAVFIPAILSGKNIYLMSILVCIYNIVTTPLIIMGYNKKSFSAIAGCMAGVMLSGLIAIVMDRLMSLTGINEHSRYLVSLPGDIDLNLNAIIFSGIIIGAMGAVMDVSSSLASALWEVKEKAKDITFKELFKSGINIGKDIMGTMADTLILAYIGSSLTAVLLLSMISQSFLGLFNSELIAVEILQALAGSFGILFAMPLTALFCSVIYFRNKQS